MLCYFGCRIYKTVRTFIYYALLSSYPPVIFWAICNHTRLESVSEFSIYTQWVYVTTQVYTLNALYSIHIFRVFWPIRTFCFHSHFSIFRKPYARFQFRFYLRKTELEASLTWTTMKALCF